MTFHQSLVFSISYVGVDNVLFQAALFKKLLPNKAFLDGGKAALTIV